MTDWQKLDTAPVNQRVMGYSIAYGWHSDVCLRAKRKADTPRWMEWGINEFDQMDWIPVTAPLIAWAPRPEVPDFKKLGIEI
jgi:hypothetical protein